MAGIAQVDEPDLLRPVQLQVLEARHGARRDVRDRLAMRARHDQVLVQVVVQAAGGIDVQGHCRWRRRLDVCCVCRLRCMVPQRARGACTAARVMPPAGARPPRYVTGRGRARRRGCARRASRIRRRSGGPVPTCSRVDARPAGRPGQIESFSPSPYRHSTGSCVMRRELRARRRRRRRRRRPSRRRAPRRRRWSRCRAGSRSPRARAGRRGRRLTTKGSTSAPKE